MTIFKSPYDTTSCSGMSKSIKDTQDAILKYLITSDEVIDFNKGVVVVDSGLTVPAFPYPMVVEKDDKTIVAIDLRAFTKISPNGEKSLSNKVEAGFTQLWGTLTEIWVNWRVEAIRDVSHVPMATFSDWITSNVASRLALDPGEAMRLRILSAIYYATLFISNDTEWNEDTRTKVATQVIKATRCLSEQVFEVIDSIETPMTDAISFCDEVIKQDISIRLKDFNIGLLLTILNKTWFGTNASAILGIALEHPPTWVAVLTMCVNERTYHNSSIAKLLSRGNQSNNHSFMLSVMNMVSNE